MADGLLTLPEEFNYRTKECDNGKYPSLNHHFTAMVDGWFFRYLAGIRPSAFGDGLTEIAPATESDLPDFLAEVRGISVERRGNRFTIVCPHPFRLALGKHRGVYPAGRHELLL